MSFLSRAFLVVALFLVGGAGYLWFGGQELFTEEREQAEEDGPDNAPGARNHPRYRYGFGYIGYHGGK